MLQMVFELASKKPQRAQNRRPGHVHEGTKPLAAVEVDNLFELIEKSRVAFAVLDQVEHC